MNRENAIDRLSGEERPWDVLIVGGGATGLGVAVDAASRGYLTALIEQHDFAKGTSSRSTKLVHGGVRYLEQGNITLVRDALLERSRLAKNAPHLVHRLGFVVPAYHWWERPYYGIGLKVYDALAGGHRLGRSHTVSRAEASKRLPTLQTDGLRGGTLYYDAQFDDTRLAVNMAQTAADHGAALANYVRATEFVKEGNRIRGVVAVDEETGKEIQIRATVVVNATGVFTDSVRRMDDAAANEMVLASQGAHVVLPRECFPGDTALIVPKTEDGRVLFAIPWHDHVVVGTTDTPLDNASLEPTPLSEELEFILHHCRKYLTGNIQREQVLSVFAGLRPLVRAGGGKKSSKLSRDHTIVVSESGLVTITGGKWTTYRKMAEDTVNRAASSGDLERKLCITKTLPIHGATAPIENDPIGYGADSAAVTTLAQEIENGLSPLHPDLPIRPVDVVWAVRNEMARTVEDVLARRTRCLFLNAQASIEIADTVSQLLAQERGLDETSRSEQVNNFKTVAAGYRIS